MITGFSNDNPLQASARTIVFVILLKEPSERDPRATITVKECGTKMLLFLALVYYDRGAAGLVLTNALDCMLYEDTGLVAVLTSSVSDEEHRWFEAAVARSSKKFEIFR